MIDRHAWEQPGAHEAAPGVHRIPLPLPGDHLHAVNIYAIADGDEVVLIDGGWALSRSQEMLAEGLAQIGYDLGQVREFLVTHLHRDHYTQAIAIRRIHGTPVSVGEGEAACLKVIQTLTSITDHPSITKLRNAGAGELADVFTSFVGERPDMRDWADPDRWLPDGVDIPLRTRTLRVIHTPGHTTGHVIFHDPAANAVFAGDHVLPHITPSIGFELVEVASPLRDYLASLELMLTLPDATLLPAHGPVTASTHDRVRELLTHHEERLTATAAQVEAGASTAFEVAQRLGWTRRLKSFADLDVFNQMMAVHETQAHLVVLAERGWLRQTDVEGVAHFAR
jgi:glyoxylase-like metal-dependent hydrolase (beta-lactamase superfamily II)